MDSPRKCYYKNDNRARELINQYITGKVLSPPDSDRWLTAARLDTQQRVQQRIVDDSDIDVCTKLKILKEQEIVLKKALERCF